MCQVFLLVAERSPDGSRCLWSPPHHHWQIGCGECSPSDDIHKCLKNQRNQQSRQVWSWCCGRVAHQVYGVSLVCISQLPWNKSLPFLSVCSGEFWETQPNTRSRSRWCSCWSCALCWCQVKLLLIVKLTSVNSKVVPYTLQLNTQVPYLSDYKSLRNINHGTSQTMKKVWIIVRKIRYIRNRNSGTEDKMFQKPSLRLVMTIMTTQNSESADMRIYQKWPVVSVFR